VSADAPSDREAGSADPASGGPVRRVQAGQRRVGVCVVVAALVLVLDIVSKLLVVANLPLGHLPVRLLGGALYLNQARNSGAAFSLGTGFTVILTIVAVAVVVVIARTAGRLRSTGWAVALGLILGGAVGNLVDRVFRAPGVLRGHVVDWISLFGPYDQYWPIFNLADSAIVCGAILAALLALLGRDLEGRRARDG
jgi:signal peptidase II